MKSARASIAALAGLACICVAVLFLARSYARRALAPALKVRAVAHQWWWEFDYPSLDIRTSDALHLPSNTVVELELVSADVIHSFWMMGMKDSLDIIPGKTRLIDLTLKSPGELYGNCDSGCGCATVCMRFRVLASAPPEFQRWAACARLSRAEFKPPRLSATPACALGTGHDGHAARDPSVGRLQKMLEGNSSASRVSR